MVAAAIDALAIPGEATYEPSFDVEAWARRTAKPGDVFDERAAEHACAFFPRYLKHTKGRWAGQPFHLLPWQRALIRTMFGWKRADGRRRFRKVLLEVARKNGKSALAAGIALYLAFCAGEQGAEVYCAATTKEQAALVFSEAARMRAQSPALRERTDYFKYNISAPSSFSKLAVLSSDHGNKDGLNVSGLVGDEIHAWKERHLYDVLHTAQGAREEPLEFLITTAGADEASFWGEEHDYAEKVRDGEIDDHEYLPVLFCADKDDAIDDPLTWAKANPSLGYTIRHEYLAKEAAKALSQLSYINTFKRLHLNIRAAIERLWLSIDHWDKCNDRPLRWDDLKGRTGWGGLDLGSTIDLTAMAIVLPRDGSDVLDLFVHCWLPRARLQERIKVDKQPYDRWADQGLLTLTDGEVTDYDVVRRYISGGDGTGGLMKHMNLVECGRDPWAATQITTQLMGDGLTMIDFRQGYASMSAPSKEFERRVLNRTINHGGNPLLRFMAKSVSVVSDGADNIKPVKPDRRKAKYRIDGIVASVIAIGRWSVAEKPLDLNGFLSNPAAT